MKNFNVKTFLAIDIFIKNVLFKIYLFILCLLT